VHALDGCGHQPPAGAADHPLHGLRARVHAFANAEVVPRVARMEREQAPDSELARLLARQGWLGPTIPTALGGTDIGHTAKTIIVEELSRVSGAAGAIVQASQLGTAALLHLGSRDQQRAWLPSIAVGEALPTIAVTEDGSGGHVLGMCTRARRRGRRWEITGRKVHIGNSHVGDLHGVVARTGEGSSGLSFFLVEAGRPGVSLSPYAPSLGLHGFSWGDIVFAGVRVPDDHRVGEVGDGLLAAHSSSILYGRPQLAAVALGLHRELLDRTLDFTQQRRRYGRPLAALPTVTDKIGRITSLMHTARVTLYSAVQKLDRGLPCDADLVNAKVVGVEALLDSVRLAMEIHAAAGLDSRSAVSRILRDAYHLAPPAGTSDVQRLRLAQLATAEREVFASPGPRRQQMSQRFPGRWAHVVDAYDADST